MVRFTMMLAHTPVIKFRKGGLGRPSAPVAAQAPSVAAPPAASGGSPVSQMQSAAASTSAIPDIDLPARYRRTPLSQEEIDKVNGGGIV